MTVKTIQQEIAINASREQVWEALMKDENNRQWYRFFAEGTHVVTDWQVGGKAIFKDGSGMGIVGHVTENRTNELLVLEYDGVVQNDVEDFDSDGAKEVKGFKESYVLSDKDGGTNLAIASDMGEDYFDMMSAAWEKALQQIKSIAENV